MKYAKGWSSTRGQATHYIDAATFIPITRVKAYAICGSPIRIIDKREMPYKKGDPRWEICDACQRKRSKP